MQATTCGVTPKKVDVYSAKVIHDFLLSEGEKIKLLGEKSCLYSDKSVIEDGILNYLNIIPDNEVNRTIKNLILNEYQKCEKMYPYLGDLFVYRYFNFEKKSKKKFSFKFTKSQQGKFLKGIDHIPVKDLVRWVFDNVNLERNITIENFQGKDIMIDVVNDFIFDFDYDFDYYKNNNGITVKNYKFLIIDGYIESMGEIHHALFKASETKEPYVIFCHGVSEEVKHNVLKNNSEGRTQFLIVDINFNEETLNVLSDLAAVHGSFVVSSKLGQTISQEMRKELKTGNSITFNKNRIKIKHCTTDESIKSHRSFLRRRISEASHDTNTDILVNRLKSFSSKNLKIYLPERIKNKKITREIDYAFRFMSNLDKDFIVKSYSFKSNYFLPVLYEKVLEEKIKNIKKIIDNISVILT